MRHRRGSPGTKANKAQKSDIEELYRCHFYRTKVSPYEVTQGTFRYFYCSVCPPFGVTFALPTTGIEESCDSISNLFGGLEGVHFDQQCGVWCIATRRGMGGQRQLPPSPSQRGLNFPSSWQSLGFWLVSVTSFFEELQSLFCCTVARITKH